MGILFSTGWSLFIWSKIQWKQ